MRRTTHLPRARAASYRLRRVSALTASASFAQAEISGGAAATGAPVPKSISVPQARLDGADKDSANFLHSNMSYAQTPLLPGGADQHQQRRASCARRSSSRPR